MFTDADPSEATKKITFVSLSIQICAYGVIGGAMVRGICISVTDSISQESHRMLRTQRPLDMVSGVGAAIKNSSDVPYE